MDVDLASCSDAFAGADDTTPLVELSGQTRTIAAIANARMMKASRRVILFCIGSERNVQPVTQLSLRPAQCCIGQARGQRRGGGALAAAGADKPAGYGARFDALRRWRLERARADSVPAFVVASDRTLDDIATLNPSNLEELHLCYGIGSSKVEKYGPEVLQVLRHLG